MARHRKPRLERIIRDALVEILRELKDPRLGMFNITYVRLSDDYMHCFVGIGTLGSEEERKNTMAVLQRAEGFVRSQLGPYLRLRHIPEIHFREDRGADHATRVYQILKDLEPELHDKEGTETEGSDA